MICWIFSWVCLLCIPLYGSSGYFFCIEGGGSKTILQVVNPEGQIVTLMKGGIKNDKIETTGSNINLIGFEGVKQVFNTLFGNSFLIEADRELDLRDLMPEARIIAGMAGASLAQNKQSLISLLRERGANMDHIVLMSDAEMALELVEREGIVLIAGTGSVCLGKCGGTLFRVGGLGRILGDGGSGYQIGLQALKAALAEEYGWGAPTSLTPILREQFQVSHLKTLIPKINLGEIPPSKIASCTPSVFNCAWGQDAVAGAIINQAVDDLSELLIHMLTLSRLSDCEVHLWGGIFKNTHAEEFIQRIRAKLPQPYQDLKMLNRSGENPAVLFAVKKLIPYL